MQNTIDLVVDHHPVAIERVLQVARYRGFNVMGLRLTRKNEAQQFLQLEVTSDRKIELLMKQLAKVFHVLELNLVSLEQTTAEIVKFRKSL